MKSFISIFIIILLPVMAYTQQQDLFFRALASMEQKQYVDAVEDLSKVISKGNARAEAYLNRSRCYSELGDYPSAINDLLKVEKLRKYTGSYQLARIYAITGKSDSATYYLERHLISSYKLPESTIKLDPAFASLEYMPSWKKLWSQEWYNEFEMLHAEINYQIKSRQYMEALDLIDQNLGKYSHRPQLFAARGEIFMNLENYTSAVNAYSKAINITKIQPEYYIRRAAALKMLGKYEDALDDLNKAIKIEPENFTLYLERSWLYNELEKYPLSIQDITFYMELFPEEDGAIYQCGQVYFSQGSYLKALEMFNKCLSLDRSKAEYFAARGDTYLETKTYRYALQDYGMSLDLKANNPDVYLNKGLARFYLNDKEGACKDWQKAVRYGSDRARELLNTHCLNLNQEH